MQNKNSVLNRKVIDNKSCTMLDSLNELLPLGKSFSIAVGYFYLSGYHLIRETFNDLALRGNIRIIMGKKTNRQTVDEINLGVIATDLCPEKALEYEIHSIDPETEDAHLVYNLRDLIAAEKVSIKVYTGPSDYFHAKAYLIGREYVTNDGFAIIGSSNFSRGGFTGNSELNILTMDSYSNIYKWFDDLWNSEDVKDFSSDLIQIIENNVIRPQTYKTIIRVEEEKFSEGTTSSGELSDNSILNNVDLPENLILRPYQIKAISNWFAANGRGTLKMATGSGKTITSLSLATVLDHRIGLEAVIVVCPYRHLVTQWSAECEKFGFQPILCFESKYKWLDKLKSKLYSSDACNSPIFVITTNSTFALEAFQGCIPYFPPKTLLIADEVHNLGSTNLVSVLPQRLGMRLGLSATPERWFDDQGTQGLFNYFGSILKPEFTLKDAIDSGALVKYYYKPILVELSDDEIDEYIEISKELKKYKHIISAQSIENTTNTMVSLLLSKRARLLGTAKNKLVKLRELMTNRLDTTHTLVYCGDGSVEEPDSLEVKRHFEAVCKLLGSDLNYRVHSYTAETTLEEREQLKTRLDTGELQGLVAIRCLDEGVDIPSIKTAIILASSINPRQFIQRRGRILRKHKNKKVAEIFDMIVVPPQNENIDFDIERNLVANEFRRYLEFAELARNAGEVKGIISDMQTKYFLHTL